MNFCLIDLRKIQTVSVLTVTCHKEGYFGRWVPGHLHVQNQELPHFQRHVFQTPHKGGCHCSIRTILAPCCK